MGDSFWQLPIGFEFEKKSKKFPIIPFHLIGFDVRWFLGPGGSSEYINGPWPRTKNGYENVDVKQCFGCGFHQKSLRPEIG